MSDTFLVTAKKVGFIYGLYRRVGDKFETTEDMFSPNWMTKDKFKKSDKPETPKLEIPSIIGLPEKSDYRKKQEAKKEVKTEVKKAPKKKATKKKKAD